MGVRESVSHRPAVLEIDSWAPIVACPLFPNPETSQEDGRYTGFRRWPETKGKVGAPPARRRPVGIGQGKAHYA